jgi:hypothetical protein
MHPSAKLVPRRYGPFLVTSAASRTSFRLKLLPTWKIHNVFHASLLTPYKETTINGNRYQEPTPNLIDRQPKWEVETILGARKRRQQLQYLVRWKGFSEAHDSWEPLTHISTDNRVREFYQTNPAAIHISHKTPPLPITICSVHIMSTISSPLNASLTTSPNPLALSDHIDNPPSPLSLSECLEYPPQAEDPVPVDLGVEVMTAAAYQEVYDRLGTPDPKPTPAFVPSTSPPPPGLNPPPNYLTYNPSDPNHSRYVKSITLHAHDPPILPHYVKFSHNFTNNQHHVFGLREDADPPTTPYGWALEAAPFIGPPLSPHVADNEALGVFDAQSFLA